MKVDIVYFSWTGNTKKAAEIISHELSKQGEVNLIEIKPKRNYSYLIWLLLSFLPNLGVKIECGEITSQLIFLCMPKWTVNCPPITTFLKSVNLKRKIIYLVITYGGFDEKRYAVSYENKVSKLCEGVKEVLLIKREKIKEGDIIEIREWVKKVIHDLKKPTE